MNFNVHIICALLVFLSGVNIISAQSTEEGQRGSVPAAAQVNTCVNSFTDQTVSTTVSVSGCNILTVQNVTVTGSGNLSLSAPSEVVISGPFDVLPGGTLSVTGGGEPQTSDFTFFYDVSGNRTSRIVGADAARKAAAVSKKSD